MDSYNYRKPVKYSSYGQIQKNKKKKKKKKLCNNITEKFSGRYCLNRDSNINCQEWKFKPLKFKDIQKILNNSCWDISKEI